MTQRKERVSMAERDVQVRFGWDQVSQKVFTSPAWRRIVVTATAESAGSRSLIFEIGRESSEIWIDDVHAFEGNVDILRRDYEHGIVVLNATGAAATVDLGGTFLRILGTGQDSINDGSSITQVTLDPFNAAILVRPE
jgi:hypothetical protein